MKVLAISGSLRRDSYNTKLLRAAEELLPPDTDFVLYDGAVQDWATRNRGAVEP